MKTTIRIMLACFAGIASYMSIILLFASFTPGVIKIESIVKVISLLIAVFFGVLLWKKTRNISVSNSLITYVLVGGIIIGTISFILGFFGPLIFSPGANQGPLLGILITGPLGVIVGLFMGGLYWLVKVKNR